MKKLIIIAILLLVLVLAVAAILISNPDLVDFLPQQAVSESQAPSDTISDPPETNPPTEPPTEAPTEEPTEEPTEAPTEEIPKVTEPPVVVELEENWATVLAGHTLTAKNYFIYDMSQGTYLDISEGTEGAKLYPASITKLWTAFVALRYVDPEQKITVGNELSLIAHDSSIAFLQPGDVLTAEELVSAMMLLSGNDATFALTTAVGRILLNNPKASATLAMERFVFQMNALAKHYGLENSHFVTPDGIHDENHYISTEDMVTLGKLAWAHPVLSKYAATASATKTFSKERTLNWPNSNMLLHKSSPYYCSYAVGLKTGYTTPAGNCLLSAFKVGSQELLIGVFGSPSSDERFADTLLLFTQVYDLEIPEPTDTEKAA